MIISFFKVLAYGSQEATFSVFTTEKLLVFSHVYQITGSVLVRLDNYAINVIFWYMHGLFDGVVDCANLGNMSFTEIVYLFWSHMSSLFTKKKTIAQLYFILE